MIHNRLHLPHVTMCSAVPDGQSGVRTNKLSRSSVRTWIPLQALVCISGHRQLRDVKCIRLGQLERGIDNHQGCHRFAESDRVADGERQDSAVGDQLVEPQVQRVLQAVVRPVKEVCDDAEDHVLIARAYGAIASPDGIPQRHSVAQCTIPSGWAIAELVFGCASQLKTIAKTDCFVARRSPKQSSRFFEGTPLTLTFGSKLSIQGATQNSSTADPGTLVSKSVDLGRNPAAVSASCKVSTPSLNLACASGVEYFNRKRSYLCA